MPASAPVAVDERGPEISPGVSHARSDTRVSRLSSVGSMHTARSSRGGSAPSESPFADPVAPPGLSGNDSSSTINANDPVSSKRYSKRTSTADLQSAAAVTGARNVYALDDPTESSLCVEKGKEGESSTELHSANAHVGKHRQRRKWWIAGAGLLVAVVLGAILGGVLGSRAARNRATQSYQSNAVNPAVAATPQSSQGAVNSTGIASNLTTGRYNTLVIFGASYCDNAHNRSSQYAASLSQPPYWQGRWSNGPVYSEYLSTLIGPTSTTNATLLDYAYAGAMIQNNITSANVPDTLTEIKTFLADAAGRNATVVNAVSRKTLMAIWEGINPLMSIWLNAAVYNGLQPSTIATAINTTNRVLTAYQNQLQLLLNNETTADLLIMPVPPIDLLPVVTAQAPTPDAVAFAANLSLQYNTGVYNIAESLGPRVIYYNATQSWVNFTSNPAQYNMTDVTTDCINDGCTNPGQYLYWDSVHPTTHTDSIFAHQLAAFLQSGMRV